jgi:hypothetical protein
VDAVDRPTRAVRPLRPAPSPGRGRVRVRPLPIRACLLPRSPLLRTALASLVSAPERASPAAAPYSATAVPFPALASPTAPPRSAPSHEPPCNSYCQGAAPIGAPPFFPDDGRRHGHHGHDAPLLLLSRRHAHHLPQGLVMLQRPSPGLAVAGGGLATVTRATARRRPSPLLLELALAAAS